MWNTISKAWQAAFEQGWEAFINGSIPIGSVIADENGEIISYGRNRICEKSTLNPKIAHAETEAIQKLDVSKYPNVKSYTLYTCMEPCLMCMGTFVMANLRKLKIAARDGYCGAVHYCNSDSYVASKKIEVDFELGIFEIVQLVMQSYYELRFSNGKKNRITEIFEKYNPVAVEIAKILYIDKRLDWHIANKTDCSKVFNEIVRLFENFK